jgi:hypothetical protein
VQQQCYPSDAAKISSFALAGKHHHACDFTLRYRTASSRCIVAAGRQQYLCQPDERALVAALFVCRLPVIVVTRMEADASFALKACIPEAVFT